MLQFQQLTAHYGKMQALFDVTLTISPGERVAIFGHNGAGKTTLLRCCVGGIEQVAGGVRYRDHMILPGQVHRNVRHGIGFVAQGHNIFRELTVAQNLRVAGLLHDPDYCHAVYRIFPILNERRTQLAGSLSGGQQQMLALSMALMTRPSILLLDEPTTGLAPIIVKDVLRSVRHINQTEGTTIVIVEQNIQATFKEVERAIVLKSGRVIYDGTSAELEEQESLWHLF